MNNHDIKLFVPKNDPFNSKGQPISKEIEIIENILSKLITQRQQQEEFCEAFRVAPSTNKFKPLSIFEHAHSYNGATEEIIREQFPLIDWGKNKDMMFNDEIYQATIKLFQDNIDLLKRLDRDQFEIIFVPKETYSHQDYVGCYKYFFVNGQRGLRKITVKQQNKIVKR